MAKLMQRAAAGLLLLSISATPFAQAQVSVGDIQNAANRSGDKSMSLLELVFGSVVHNPLAVGGSGGMLAQVFLVLNSCMLAVGVLWAMYHFGAALIATGQEGEFMGQKKSSPWFIIRMCAGFSSLVPLFGGYCGAQVIMLWGTMMGVGIANLSLDAALAVLKSGGSMIAAPAAPQATTLAKALFEANLCAQAANTAIDNMPTDTGGVSVDPAEKFSTLGKGDKVVLMNQLGLSCGGAEVAIEPPQPLPNYDGMTVYSADPGPAYEQMISAHRNALSTIQSTLSSAAQAYVSAVASGVHPADPQDTINKAALQYQATITQALDSSSSTLHSLESLVQSNLQRDGWIMMGAWYQTFAQANSQMTSLANATASAVPSTDLENLPYPQLYRKVLAAYSQQIQQAASTGTPQDRVNNLATGTTDPKNIMSKIFPGQALVKMAIGMNSGQGPNGATNPLIGMKNLGDYILAGGWTALSGYAVVKGGLAASDSMLGKTLSAVGNVFSGGVLGAIKEGAKGMMDALGPFIVVMVITLFFFGAALSLYIPMLPFMIWFGGIVSWYAVVGEAMVAAPLWAMTHLDGEGEGMGQRTTHGYIFLLNVMFRPVFMVIGFILAGTGIVVLGTLLNTMFGVAMQNAQYDSLTGLVSIIGFIVLYVGMCQTLVQGTFSLIHVVPDQVFAWIGGQMASIVGRDMHEKSQQHLGAGVGQGSNSARSRASELLHGASTGKPFDSPQIGKRDV
ncbi:DotA/TraY family protein [Ralstonia pseudosolanacearum]|uniref:DotA/TraY family protein n=1 Tax=Ralstonia pseudosolanacearum TaxID=1310165 RepID=UPI001FFB8FE4|nr:DotA/TraY family protein [Ralstonia pseudosolanacearum]